MPATLATIDPLLKEVYRGQLREQLNTETVALKRVIGGGDGQRSSSSAGITSDVGGRYVTFPLHVSRNNGIGSRFEGEALPIPGNQGMAAIRTGLHYGYGSVQLTGQTIALTDSDAQAFARALDLEMNGLKNDILKDMNRQVYGSGNGAVGTVSAVSSGATITVADARLFQIGEKIDIIRLSSGAYASTVAASSIGTPILITAVSLATGANTITISGATPTVAVGDIITRAGSGIAAAGTREITGLGAIIDNTSTLFNLSPSAQPVWAAQVNSNGGTTRALSEGLMIQMVDNIRIQGGHTSLILQSLGVRRSYFNLLSQNRSVVNQTSFTGGFTGLAFTTDMGEIPVVADPDAPLNTQWFINEDVLTFYRESEWDWFDRDGSIWKQVVDANGRYDAWVAYLGEYHELGTDRRNSHGIIKDIAES